MRSILREKSQDYFSILKHDKSHWVAFWEKYCQENAEFMSGYARALDLGKEEVASILKETNRPFLDKIKQKNEQIKHLKQNAAKTLNLYNEELELSKEDFVIYLIGALGIQDTISFKTKDRMICLIDIVSLYKNCKMEELQNITLFTAKKARKLINEQTQEGF